MMCVLPAKVASREAKTPQRQPPNQPLFIEHFGYGWWSVITLGMAAVCSQQSLVILLLGFPSYRERTEQRTSDLLKLKQSVRQQKYPDNLHINPSSYFSSVNVKCFVTHGICFSFFVVTQFFAVL